MTTPKEEYSVMRHRIRYYKRQAWASTVAFVIAVAMLAIFISQAIEARAELTKAAAVIDEQVALLEVAETDNASMRHYILTLQGRLNSCRIESGLPAINFEKYQ